jgi:hypothetical protein
LTTLSSAAVKNVLPDGCNSTAATRRLSQRYNHNHNHNHNHNRI